MTRVLILTFLISLSSYASNTPESESSIGAGLSLRHFHKFSPLIKSLIELNIEPENSTTTKKELQLGARFRLHQNIKVSGYYRNSYGLRHQDDWIKENNIWKWIDSSKRRESILGTNIILRAVYLDNILELRTSLERNFHNQQNTMKIRPGITHLFMNSGSPFINLFLQYEAYFPLNYHEKLIYKHGLYTGMLYHWKKWIKPGLFLKYTTTVWQNSEDAISRNVPSYNISDTSTIIGVNINFYY